MPDSQWGSQGRGAVDQGADWPDYTTDRPRTAVGWTGNRRHFFLIVATSPGWTWNETRDFFTTGLSAYMQQMQKVTIRISDAMMLDGGGSTSFKYRWKDASGNPVQGWDPPPINTSRKIPDIVHVWAKSPK
ncbi:MAG: phosphodiester glycosidase family protein [Abditibacteriales bacterium]|nr:phosphodiester glycosidase family protein [Abditibacteriales bacterium]